MTSDDDLRVYLRFASGRTALDSPVIRLGTLAQVALELAGARVLLSPEAGPGKPRDDAFSWTIEHDHLLRDLRADTSTLRPATGGGLVISDDARTVARSGLADASAVPESVLWAAPATCLIDPPATPPAALTLTDADARALREAGVHAVSLLAWPDPPASPAVPRRVVIAVAGGAEPELQPLVDAVRSSLPGRPVIDIVADTPLHLDGVRHAPLHPWRRSRAIRSCELTIVLGRSASTDLVAAEAARHKIACLQAEPTSTSPSMLPFPAEPDAGSSELRLALPALAQWLVTVVAPTTIPGSEES